MGAVIVATGTMPPHSEMLRALGAAFIIAGAVGIYMMLATRQVAKKPHERFNEQNTILATHTDILNKMDNSLKEIASSQKEIVSSLKGIDSKLQSIDGKLDPRI